MPEGHTIHRLARDLNRTLRPGALAAGSLQDRFRDEAAVLDGTSLRKADAWGKHLFLDFEDGPLLHVHLGLIGTFRQKGPDAPERGAIRLRLANESTTWDLTGPMACHFIDDDELEAIVGKLGPDPLRRGADKGAFVTNVARRRVPIAAALLDQAVVAGIGNVYRSEFCYLEGVHPSTTARDLPEDTVGRIWDLAVSQLKLGVRLNRIVTRDPDEVGVSAGRIPRGERLYVYKRDGEPCHRCADEIRTSEIGTRKAWYCPTCQR